MSELPAVLQAAITAILGGGSGLVTAAIRGARRFATVEEQVNELEKEHVNSQGRIATLEFFFKNWADRTQLIDALPRILENIQGVLKGIQQNVGDIYTRLDGVRIRLEELERKVRAAKSDIKDLQDEKKIAVLESQIRSLAEAIERLRDEDKEFLRLETFVSFTEEQGRQWNEIQRTLGRLEGLLKASSTSTPGMPRVPMPPRLPPKK